MSIDLLTAEQRIRIHERLLQAQGLIDQAADELTPRDEAKAELKAHARAVWLIGTEISGLYPRSSTDG